MTGAQGAGQAGSWRVTVRGFSETPVFPGETAKQAKMAAWKAIKAAGYQYSLPDFMALATAQRVQGWSE